MLTDTFYGQGQTLSNIAREFLEQKSCKFIYRVGGCSLCAHKQCPTTCIMCAPACEIMATCVSQHLRTENAVGCAGVDEIANYDRKQEGDKLC